MPRKIASRDVARLSQLSPAQPSPAHLGQKERRQEEKANRMSQSRDIHPHEAVHAIKAVVAHPSRGALCVC